MATRSTPTPRDRGVPTQRQRDMTKSAVTTDRVWTIPNILSMARLVGVLVFLWLMFAGAYGAALALLVVSSATDWLDGHLARKWDQISPLGQVLDPIADRAYIIATLIAFLATGIVPPWFGLLVMSRDVVMVVLIPVLRRTGRSTLPVHFIGKAGTFILLAALPLLLLAEIEWSGAGVTRTIGWAFSLWGAGLYWWAGVVYFIQMIDLLRRQRTAAA